MSNEEWGANFAFSALRSPLSALRFALCARTLERLNASMGGVWC